MLFHTCRKMVTEGICYILRIRIFGVTKKIIFMDEQLQITLKIHHLLLYSLWNDHEGDVFTKTELGFLMTDVLKNNPPATIKYTVYYPVTPCLIVVFKYLSFFCVCFWLLLVCFSSSLQDTFKFFLCSSLEWGIWNLESVSSCE